MTMPCIARLLFRIDHDAEYRLVLYCIQNMTYSGHVICYELLMTVFITDRPIKRSKQWEFYVLVFMKSGDLRFDFSAAD